MKIPSKLFLQTLTPKKIYWFSTNPPSGISEHYHICITKNDDGFVIFACCTSQEDTMNRLIEKQGLSSSTIVHIKKGNYNFVRDTFINCNQIFMMTTEQFADYYDKNGIELISEINLNHYQQIINGIKDLFYAMGHPAKSRSFSVAPYEVIQFSLLLIHLKDLVYRGQRVRQSVYQLIHIESQLLCST